MSAFEAIGRRIGEDAVAELAADGSLDWAIRSGALDGIETAAHGISDAAQRERILQHITVERGRLGASPQQPDGAGVEDVLTVLLLAAALVGMFWFAVWLFS